MNPKTRIAPYYALQVGTVTDQVLTILEGPLLGID